MKSRTRAYSTQRRHSTRGRPWHFAGLKDAVLEPRLLPAVLTFPAAIHPVSESGPNDTVDAAQGLGDLSITPAAGVSGRVGDGHAASADVDWYRFVLARPARVSLVSGPRAEGGTFRGVVSLYNEDPFDFADFLNPLGHRLLAQGQAGEAGGLARIDAVLGPGAYDVAISGAGNRFFNPFLAASGYDGSTGDYNLLAAATVLDLGPDDGPTVLSSVPLSGAVLDRSPLAIRLGLSGPLHPDTVIAGQTVQLLDGNDLPVDAWVNYSAAANELQLFPTRPLPEGLYRVVLRGDSSPGGPVLASPLGAPLGAIGSALGGQDEVFTFRVNGIAGGSSASDTPATARDLGDLTSAGLVQAEGVIGDDAYFDPSSEDPTRNPGNGVEMYHFRVVGPGRFAFLAEVFAQRIGSPLDPGLALYRLDPSGQGLIFVAGNNNTGDGAVATNGTTPLGSDAALFAGLTAGDYYLAVSTGGNTPSPLENMPPGTPGLYDPNQSHSGQNGYTTGPYVLNILVRPDTEAPRVLATWPSDSAILDAPPTVLTVQFSEPVNLQQLSYEAYQLTTQSSLASVYVLGPDGTKYFPRLESYDRTTNTARFLMLDALPNGTHELHLSGAAGLADLAGRPLAGNTSSGDYVTRFEVNGPARGDHGDPTIRTAAMPTAGPQDLGIIFPHEWEAGVQLTRDYTAAPTGAPTASEDGYQFTVIQRQTYSFLIGGVGLPTDRSPLSLTDAAGSPVEFGIQGDGSIILADLGPGTYVLRVGSWSPEHSAGVVYGVTMKLVGVAGNPPPLVDGPSPALQLRLTSLPGTALIDPPAETIAPAPTSPPDSAGNPGSASGGALPTLPTPAPTSPPGGAGNPGSPSGGGLPTLPSPTVPTPTSPPGGVGDQGGSATSPVSAPAVNSSPSTSPTPLTPVGLIALSVAPVGNLHGNAQPFAPSTTEVAFILPSQATPTPSLGEALVQMIVTTQVLRGDDPAGPGDPSDAVPGGELSGPALIFEEGLKTVTEAAPQSTGDADAVVDLETAAAETSATRESEDATSDELSASEEGPLPAEAGEVVEDAGREVQLAAVPWVVGLASIATALFVLIKQYRPARSGPLASSSLNLSARSAEELAEDHLGPARPDGARNRHAPLSTTSPRGGLILEESGLRS